MGVSRIELAVALGVTEQAVYKADKGGKLPKSKLPDGTFDLTVALAEYNANRKHGAGPGRPRKDGSPPHSHQGEDGKPTIWELQRKHERVKIAERKEKLRRSRGNHVAWKPFRAQMFEFVRRERDAWQTWPAQVADKLAAEFGADLSRVQIALEREVRAYLSELAKRIPLGPEPARSPEPAPQAHVP